MAVKYSLQVGARNTVFIVIADTIAFWFMFILSLYGAEYFSLDYTETILLIIAVYLVIYNLPAYFSRGKSWGMLLYEVSIYRNGEPLSVNMVILRSLLFLPVYCSYVTSLITLFKGSREHQIDPLFNCYCLRKDGEYLNQD